MIVHEWVRLVLGNWILFLPPMILLAAWLIARRLGWLPKGRALSESSPVGSRISHRAEAIVLLCVAGAIFVFAATNASTGGRLLILDQLSPAFARANVLAAVGAGLGVLIGASVALFYRTSTGVIVAAGVLCIYGLVLNGPVDILRPSSLPDTVRSDTPLTFTLSAPDAEGAELYVNGVRLGTLPYETTHGEFQQSVPVWNEPNELRRTQSWLHVLDRSHPRSGTASRIYPPWSEITVGRRTYYARVKLGDEWGYWQIHSGITSVGEGYRLRGEVVALPIMFPTREERIETLLDIARLNDYSPNAEWFEAMETYRSDGWFAVRQAMDKEPRMAEVLNRWAAWKYDLGATTDPKSVWRVFERIRAQADQRQYYMTSDIAGWAVERLAPRLDPDRLVRLAQKIVRSKWLYGSTHWQMNNRVQFGTSLNSEGLHTGVERAIHAWGGRGDEWLSPGDYAVAHAVWTLDEALDAEDDTQPNLVERELVPILVAWNYNNMQLLPIAAHVGGDAVERYLLRQNWGAEPDDLPWGQRIQTTGLGGVNGWLHLLAHLRSPAGRQFRRENPCPLMQMADRYTDPINSPFWERGLEFLFLDLDLGTQCLAMQYWPRFKERAAQRKHEALSLQYQYLVRMEPLSTVDMYVQCWREFSGDPMMFREGIDAFARSSIPYDKRQRIHVALKDAVQQGRMHAEPTSRRNEQDARRELLGYLDSRLVPITDVERAGDLISALRAGDSTYPPESVAVWLAHSEPSHPLVRMLAEANEPSLRLLAMGALREHPTPANRAILDKLLVDADEQVRSAAEGVAKELAALKETPVAQFADKRTGPVVP